MSKRDAVLESLRGRWDVIVIGGGITGAGILREAASRGLRCLLLEQRDFGWGTSSRSGKLVHGGLRYLRQGQVRTTWHSVREREKLLREYKGLVDGLGFLVPTYREDRFGPLALGMGLAVYDLLALKRSRRRHTSGEVAMITPLLKSEGLTGGFWYRDARTDDARLVIRVIREGVRLGGTALNYARVEALCRSGGRVTGVAVRDVAGGKTFEVHGQAVINASGVWAGQVHSLLGKKDKRPGLRPLRGSHLVFPRWRFPLPMAVGLTHPGDGRSLYVFPWEDITLVGTTDLDHEHSLDDEPRISVREGIYLLELVQRYFPSLNLTGSDVIATFSGVRPVVNTGRKDPSKESRDHVVWDENGMVTITGGKLTTFGLLAREALASAGKYISRAGGSSPVACREDSGAEPLLLQGEDGEASARRLSGRYGTEAAALLEEAGPEDLRPLPGTGILRVELRWAARHEAVAHLDDILLRRVRLGILLPRGGADLLDDLRPVLQKDLGWSDGRWEDEVSRYTAIWRQAYSPDLIK
ncbi:MAG: glycerol-3-phosphate dehydrogenase/oxidase [Actinobacteria bacterium]|nr:glycerol-3-phosphate dehydrogenase/oxidase [Actinomycetota bacterium]